MIFERLTAISGGIFFILAFAAGGAADGTATTAQFTAIIIPALAFGILTFVFGHFASKRRERNGK